MFCLNLIQHIFKRNKSKTYRLNFVRELVHLGVHNYEIKKSEKNPTKANFTHLKH